MSTGFHFVVTGRCAGCGACLLTCPEHAIRPGADVPLVVLAGRCTGCGECVEVCPVDAVVEAAPAETAERSPAQTAQRPPAAMAAVVR